MLHRRLLVDDHWGVGEALNEMAYGTGLVARGKHYILFDFDPNEAFRRTRLLEKELYAQPLITFDIDNKPAKEPASGSSTNIIALPENVNLLTIEPISQNKRPFINNVYLIRFEHLFDVDEHPILSLPVTIPLRAFIEGYFETKLNSVQETNLGGDRFKEETIKQRFDWTSRNIAHDKCSSESIKASSGIVENNFDYIELQPMEIRTFQIELL